MQPIFWMEWREPFDFPIGISGFPLLKVKSYQVKKQDKIALYYLSLTSYLVRERKAMSFESARRKK